MSDIQPGRALTDWPADVAEAADKLGLARFSVAGASGGGPYPLACAWQLPGRVSRLIADLAEAFRQGSDGATHDMVLLGRPWGFSLREIEPEV